MPEAPQVEAAAVRTTEEATIRSAAGISNRGGFLPSRGEILPFLSAPSIAKRRVFILNSEIKGSEGKEFTPLSTEPADAFLISHLGSREKIPLTNRDRLPTIWSQ